MSDTLRDQLLGLGFKQAPKPAKPPRDGKQKPGTRGGKPDAQPRQPAHGKAKKPHPRNPASREDIDLAKAYAIRAQREKDERIAAERLKQEQARQRREAKAKLAALLKDKALNDANADLVRHFDYGGKIKRIHVTADQLKALNAGELGVVQLDGRYLLVTADVLAQAEATFAPAVALKVDPDAPAADDEYADSRFQVPDDLVW
ncbi:DUF2058 domain-containing protein [Luteimonas soli]|uniref:DUF2058 domain-containing protein n=1 Tax=Luteimonas soli TaxID=1648966 RepID=A0ABV7XIN9_9GAMM